MAGLEDLLDSAKGTVRQGLDFAREKTVAAADAIANRLRGAPVQPEAAPGPQAGAPAYDASAQPARAAAATAQADAIKSPLDPRFADPLADHNAKIRTMNNPVLDQDAMQQRIGQANDNFKGTQPASARTGTTATLEEQMAARGAGAVGKAGALRGAMNTVGKFAAPLAAVAGVPDQLASGGASNMDDQIAQSVVGDNNTARSIAGNALSLARRTGNALSAVPFTDIRLNAGDKLFGGLNDLAHGQALGTTTFEDAARPAARPAGTDAQRQADDNTNGGITAIRPSEATIPTIRGGNVTPEQLIAGREVPVAGTGAFKRTTPGNVGKAVGIDTRSAPVQPEGGPYKPRTLAGAMTTFKGQQQNQADKIAEAELGIKDTNARVAAARLGMELGDKNRKVIADRLKSESGRELYGPDGKPVDTSGMKPEELKAAQEKQHANVVSRLEYSMGQRGDGKTMESATPAEVNQLLLGEKFKRAIDRGRGDKLQYLKDFFGDKRHDSDNVYSYLPAYREGNRIFTHNGNSVAGSTAVGGEFQFLGPNTPVDADMMRHLRNLPTKEQYEAAQKKGK